MDKIRILYEYDYLRRYSDKMRARTLREIQSYLHEIDILENVAILTIRRDLQDMQTAGFPVRQRSGRHNTQYYWIDGGAFNYNEMRFLVDSLSMNKFLSSEQKHDLTQKFLTDCTPEEKRKLEQRVKVQETPVALDLLDNLEKIYQVLEVPQTIHFYYARYDAHMHCTVAKRNARTLVPVDVVYDHERFYMVCMDMDTGKRRVYRVDRMRHITRGEPVAKKPSFPEADGAVLDIFEPDAYETVHCRVRWELVDDVLDRCGKYAYVIEEESDEAWAAMCMRVGISTGFYRWIAGYGDMIRIVSPTWVRDKYTQSLHNILDLYQGDAQSSS